MTGKIRTWDRVEPCSYWPEEKGLEAKKRIFVPPLPNLRTDFKFARLADGAAAAGAQIYENICPGCPADIKCAELRIDNANFSMSERQKKKRDLFLQAADVSVNKRYSSPQIFQLFADYFNKRHQWDKDYSADDVSKTYKTVTESNSHIMTAIGKQSGKVIAAAFIDEDGNGNTHGDILVYDMSPDVMKLSPGISMLLNLAARSAQLYPEGKVYLGSWSPGSPKLGYKSQFRGLEYHEDNAWKPLASHPASPQI